MYFFTRDVQIWANLPQQQQQQQTHLFQRIQIPENNFAGDQYQLMWGQRLQPVSSVEQPAKTDSHK
jgi:hypothetical protein